MLGIIGKLLIVKEELFPGGKDKYIAAGDALHGSVDEFHLRLSDTRERNCERFPEPSSAVAVITPVHTNWGPGRFRVCDISRVQPLIGGLDRFFFYLPLPTTPS